MLPFYKEDLLVDIVLRKFVPFANNFKIILATTDSPADDRLVDHCAKYPIEIFRGSEENVLQRFIDAGRLYDLETIIRVCSDNPFFDIAGTLRLLDFPELESEYIAYKMDDGSPTIKSHLGFWGEVVTQKALVKARNMTSDELYLQHTTNFLYANPDHFNIKLIVSPDGIGASNDIRLTLDTEADLIMLRQLYTRIVDEGIPNDPRSIIDFIDYNPFYKKQMKKQINANAK